MDSIRKRLTYANVMSSLAVFLVLGGGAAFAAINLPANSVGSRELQPNAVKTGYLAKNAVRTGKVAFEAIRAGKLSKNAVPTNRLRDNAVTGDKVNESTLGEVPNAAKLDGRSVNDLVMWAFVESNGALVRSSGGVSSESIGTGAYKVTFPRAVDSCAYNATNAAPDNVVPATAQIAVAESGDGTNAVRVATADSGGTAANDQFMLVVTC